MSKVNSNSSHLVILIIIAILFIYIYLCLSQNSTRNKGRHQTDEYHYAHFSKIDSTNFYFYPSLLLTSPMRFTLHEGDSLFIPAKWWHWIQSTKSIAVNYWIIDKKEQQISLKEPCHLKLNLNYDAFLSELYHYQGEVNIWNQSTNEIETKVTETIDKDENDKYVITLSGYSDKEKLNSTLLNQLEKYIQVPLFLSKCIIDKNLWISQGKTDTGLHYDDYDGILTVIKGSKEIVLYPPKDSIYLDPFDNRPYWVSHSAPLKFEYNKYELVSLLDTTKNYSSSRLLYESMKCVNNKKLLEMITKVTRTIGLNKTIWGFKKKGDELRWEIYFYHFDMQNSSMETNLKNVCIKDVPSCKYFSSFDKTMIIHSFDMYNNEKAWGEDMHLYHRSSDMVIPFFGNGSTISVQGVISKESLFVLDTSTNFINHFSSHLKNIQLDAQDFETYLKHYKCKNICIHNKFDGNIFIQYLGIVVIDFIQFLKQFKYPTVLIDHVIKYCDFYENIEHEITIVYNIETKIPVRSAFYGIV